MKRRAPPNAQHRPGSDSGVKMSNYWAHIGNSMPSRCSRAIFRWCVFFVRPFSGSFGWLCSLISSPPSYTWRQTTEDHQGFELCASQLFMASFPHIYYLVPALTPIRLVINVSAVVSILHRHLSVFLSIPSSAVDASFECPFSGSARLIAILLSSPSSLLIRMKLKLLELI